MKNIENIFKGFESEGTIFGSINKTNFENIETIIPEKRVIQKFEKLVNSIDEKILNNSFELQYLTQIKNSLLPQLMNGKIEVKA
jgi:type I restriction enzyme S subunit